MVFMHVQIHSYDDAETTEAETFTKTKDFYKYINIDHIDILVGGDD